MKLPAIQTAISTLAALWARTDWEPGERAAVDSALRTLESLRQLVKVRDQVNIERANTLNFAGADESGSG